MGYTLAQIEDGILATLNQVPISAYIRTIDSYHGELEGEIDSIILRFPAIFVAFEGADYEARTTSGRVQSAEVSFFVLVCDRNLRGNKAARRGEAGSVGTYRMLEDVRGLLLGKRPATLPNLAPFQLSRETDEANRKDLSIYSALYVTRQVL